MLHYFCRYHHVSAIDLLLQWIFSYRSLFSKPCSQCQRVLALDRPTDLLLPPIIRTFDQLTPSSLGSAKLKHTVTAEEVFVAYHRGCYDKHKSSSG
ncbi:hypothetical protein O6H91_Y477500 [Diphasiastrum complanatum]|nr:hypothetical protein O6H91_Y477500 [Diphasiastrum complanatum]